MKYYPVVLIDSGILVAYYSKRDVYHSQVRSFFGTCRSNLVTTVACITEVMWLLSGNSRVQNQLLSEVVKGVFELIPLISEDFARISELNTQYADLPGDFADLSLIAISERLDIAAIATLDSDFDIYRRYRTRSFERVFLPQ